MILADIKARVMTALGWVGNVLTRQPALTPNETHP